MYLLGLLLLIVIILGLIRFAWYIFGAIIGIAIIILGIKIVLVIIGALALI